MSVIINPSSGGGGSGITELTGDVTAGPGSGSQAATLAPILTAGGPVGDSTHTPVITWDAKGRLIAVTSAAISGGGGGMAIGSPVTGGTSGSVLYIDGSTNLAQDNANFNWADATLTLQIGSTSKASLVGSITGAYDGTTHGSVRIGGSPGATSFFDLMSNPNGANSIPVPTFRPVVANKTIALDLCPNGSPSDFGYGKAWFDLCNTDQITSGNLATQAIHMSAHATSFFLGGAKYNSAAVLPFNFGTLDGDTPAETTTFTINADASLTIAQPTKFSSMTSGSIPYFGASGLLSQDNAKFSWDDTNGILKVDGGNAVFKIANVSGDNWFEGDAGNLTLTGSQNFGTGSLCLMSLTTGIQNTAIGSEACKSVTTGSLNVAFGTLSLENCTTGSNNMAIGGSVLRNVVTGSGNTGIGVNAISQATGDNNTAVGLTAGRNVSSGSNNVAIGDQALGGLSNVLPDLGNVAIGHNSSNNLTSGNFNVGVGWGSNSSLVSGSSNVSIGVNAGQNFTPGGNNTFVGGFSGKNITSGDNNTLLGGWGGPSGAMSSVIALSDGAGNVKLDYGNTNAATWTSPAAICVTPVAVASLPSASIVGQRHFVTDATATTFASIVAGSGANKVPVYADGTNWRIG